MKKPIPKERKPLLDYSRAIRYLEHKYNFKSRGYEGIPHGADKVELYRDFWHWLVEDGGVRNESEIFLPVVNSCLLEGEEWVRDILDLFKEEFSECIEFGEVIPVWVEW